MRTRKLGASALSGVPEAGSPPPRHLTSPRRVPFPPPKATGGLGDSGRSPETNPYRTRRRFAL